MPSHPGVGLGIVRGMCKQFKGTVYLTARYSNNPACMEHKLQIIIRILTLELVYAHEIRDLSVHIVTKHRINVSSLKLCIYFLIFSFVIVN